VKRFILWTWMLMFVYLIYAVTYIIVHRKVKKLKLKENNNG